MRRQLNAEEMKRMLDRPILLHDSMTGDQTSTGTVVRDEDIPSETESEDLSPIRAVKFDEIIRQFETYLNNTEEMRNLFLSNDDD